MIHTNELMLGNWVEYATGLNGENRSIPMYVTGIFSDTVYLNFDGNEGDVFEEEEENLIGIPITEELLEKCGFIRSNKWEDGSNCFLLDSLKSWLIDGEMCIEADNLHSIMEPYMGEFPVNKVYEIHFLHELQNTYFMLTKKHLEIKL